jgi:hypothetical protein
MERLILPCKVSLFTLRRDLYHVVKSHWHGANGFTSTPKESVLLILSPSVGLQPVNIESNSKHANPYTSEENQKIQSGVLARRMKHRGDATAKFQSRFRRERKTTDNIVILRQISFLYLYKYTFLSVGVQDGVIAYYQANINLGKEVTNSKYLYTCKTSLTY